MEKATEICLIIVLEARSVKLGYLAELGSDMSPLPLLGLQTVNFYVLS
jgi:hypothetical protein